MEPERKATTEHQEIGVCRTGKHRIINAVPLPLTPHTASSIPPGSIKRRGRKKGRGKLDLEPHLQNPHENTRSRSLSKTPDDTSSIAGSDISGVSSVVGSEHHARELRTDNEVLSSESSTAGNHIGYRSSINKEESYSANEVDKPVKVTRSTLLGKRERVIEISPSLRLPVTAMPSGPSNSTTYDFGRGVIREATTEKGALGMAAYVPSVSSSRTSLSDMTSLGLSVSEDADDISTFSEQDSNLAGPGNNVPDLQAECERLKAALKLADADIAILVSAKQQLQLEFHHEQEKVKVLSRYVLDDEGKKRDSENTIEHLEASLHEQKERSQTELERCRGQVLELKSEIEALHNSLDATVTDRDLKKLKIGHLERDLATHQAKFNGYEKEITELRTKNIELENVLQDTNAKGEGNKSFIKLLSQEKNDVIKRFQEREGAITMLEITNKTLEARIVDLQHANQRLLEKSEECKTRFREINAENVTLSSRLQVASREKSDLSSAVRRLRSDITKVENSFSRLKQQLLEKTQLAEQESMRSNELSEQVQSLTSQVAKLDNVNAETRIRDKNVQIEQLLSLSKVSNMEKAKLEKQVEKLGQHIASNEKSWVEAIQREKRTSRLLQEKDDLISQKSGEIARLSASLEKERQRHAEMTQDTNLSEETLAQLRIKLAESEKTIQKIAMENCSISDTVEQLRTELLIEKEAKRSSEVLHGQETARLQEKIHKLNDEVDMLQKKVVSSNDQLQLYKKDLAETSDLVKEQHEDHSIQQMELLSELQSARRELLQEKDALIQENSRLKASIDALQAKTRELEENFYKEKLKLIEEREKLQAVAIAERADLQSEVEAALEKLKQNEKSKLRIEEEILVIKDHNNVLSQQLGALQIHDRQLAEELEKKIKENSEIISEHKVTKEELAVMKQEFSKLAEQLTTSVQENGDQDEEKDLLRNAVIRQQQYCISLQKHYEKWAKDVAIEMRAEVARYKRRLRSIDAHRENFRYSTSDPQHVRSTYELAQPYQHNVLYPENENLRIEEALDQSVKYEKDLEAVLAETSQSPDLHEISDIAQGGNHGSICDHVHKIMPGTSDASTQTYHDDEYALSSQILLANSETEALAKEKLSLLEENTQQAELIAELEERIQNWSMSDSAAVAADSSTQTLHDEDLLPVPSDTTAKLSSLLEDSSSQTDHDSEPVGRKSVTQVEEELFALKDVSDQKIMELQQQNTLLNTRVSDLAKQLQDLKDARNSMLEDSSTQTSHDEVLLPGVSSFNARHEVSSTLLEDSSTQTDHERDVVSQGMQDFFVIENELKLAEDKVGRLSLELQNAMSENRRLNATIIDCEKFFMERNHAEPTQTSLEDDITVTKSPCPTMADVSCQTDHRQKFASSGQLENNSVDGDYISHDPELPSPMLILRTMESKKLKAYKKTVHLMKKKLECAEEKIAHLQLERKVLSEKTVDSSDGSRNESITLKAVEEELFQVKKTAFIQEEDAKRRAVTEKKISESKISVMLEKISSLTDANEQLRNSVQVLQVKLTEKSRQCSIVLKEKGRYQTRARRLQASLRSLAWITGNQDKAMGLSEDILDESVSDSSLISENLAENTSIGAHGDAGTPKRSNSAKFSLSLPASVVEIEASLKDLQSEIVALEKQMQEHSTAVRHSKTQWTRLKEESRVLSSPQQSTITPVQTGVNSSGRMFKAV